MTVSSKPNMQRLNNAQIMALTAGRASRVKRNRKGARKPKSGKKTPVLNCTLPVVGDLVTGVVTASGDRGVFVTVNSKIPGRVKLCDISTRFISGQEVAEIYPVGHEIHDMIVTAISDDRKVELKLKTRIGDPEVGSIHKAVVKRVEKYGVIMGFPNSLMRCLCSTEEVDDELERCRQVLANILPGHKCAVKVIKVEQSKIWVTMKQSQLGKSANKQYDQHVMQFADPNVVAAADEEDSTIPTTFSQVKLIETVEPKPETKKRPITQTASALDALEAASETEEAEDSKNKKKSKRQKDAARREKEARIREKEESILAGDWKRDPQTAEEFERLLVVEGNSSPAVWIKYMAFWLKIAEVSKARETAERAIKNSSMFAHEQDRLNLWIAYLNMEAAFGNNADAVFTRATQYCDAKKVYHAISQVWVRANQFDKAQVAFERMTSKFPECRKAWMNLVEFLVNQDRQDEARTVFSKAIRTLPKRKHIRATVKFAQFEFRNGHAARGATVFEQLLQSNSQKTDIWSVYFDETIKAYTPPVSESVDLETVRKLFERAVTLKLKAFKMKFFFKRWLDFEQRFGTDDGVEDVKARAIAYVESISAE